MGETRQLLPGAVRTIAYWTVSASLSHPDFMSQSSNHAGSLPSQDPFCLRAFAYTVPATRKALSFPFASQFKLSLLSEASSGSAP